MGHDNELQVLVSFLDERPWADEPQPGVVHRMSLEVTVANGCAHLVQMALALGPAIVQSFISVRAAAMTRGELTIEDSASPSPGTVGSCHVWAPSGPALRKLEAGWRPGTGPYPSPPLSDFVNRAPEAVI